MKMVHNGIEYGDMQLICEAYHLMKDVLHLSHDELAQVRLFGPFSIPRTCGYAFFVSRFSPNGTKPNWIRF